MPATVAQLAATLVLLTFIALCACVSLVYGGVL